MDAVTGIQAEGLSVSLTGPDGRFTLVVEDLALGPGEVLALTGQSGTGKTLLLELLGLVRAPDAGRYAWRDAEGRKTNLSDLWTDGKRSNLLAKTRGALFGFIPQTGGLLPYLSVRDNIALSQRLAGRTNAGLIDRLIQELDLSRIARSMPGLLSAGQRQRVAIARALAHEPFVVLADEPTASLDPENSDRVLSLLLETAERCRTAVLLSSHEVERLDRFGLKRCALHAATDGRAVTSRLEHHQI